jgi:hypothetical protein
MEKNKTGKKKKGRGRRRMNHRGKKIKKRDAGDGYPFRSGLRDIRESTSSSSLMPMLIISLVSI